MTSSNPNYLPKFPPPNTITLGVGLQHMNFGRHKHSVHNNDSKGFGPSREKDGAAINRDGAEKWVWCKGGEELSCG